MFPHKLKIIRARATKSLYPSEALHTFVTSFQSMSFRYSKLCLWSQNISMGQYFFVQCVLTIFLVGIVLISWAHLTISSCFYTRPTYYHRPVLPQETPHWLLSLP